MQSVHYKSQTGTNKNNNKNNVQHKIQSLCCVVFVLCCVSFRSISQSDRKQLTDMNTMRLLYKNLELLIYDTAMTIMSKYVKLNLVNGIVLHVDHEQ